MANNHIPLTLEQHQQILYEILYMVDDFCTSHDIPYFLVGGTLLGAVRHQGIIPWDDDVDIAMTRENYERFITLFHAEGIDGYKLYDFEHVDGYLYPFAKMAKSDTWTEAKETHKISIDIFVYDGCGDSLGDAQQYFSKLRNKVQKFAFFYLLNIPFNQIYDCWKSKLVYFLTEFPEDILSLHLVRFSQKQSKKYIRRLCAQCKRLRVASVQFSACIVWGLYGKGEVQPSSSFINLNKMKFGNRELPVPSGWHDYLTGIYGDYMTLPPIEKRKQHLKHASCMSVPLKTESR